MLLQFTIQNTFSVGLYYNVYNALCLSKIDFLFEFFWHINIEDHKMHNMPITYSYYIVANNHKIIMFFDNSYFVVIEIMFLYVQSVTSLWHSQHLRIILIRFYLNLFFIESFKFKIF